MTYCFGDSFDLYATTSDPYGNGYWDSGTGANYSLQAGRFGGRCLQNITTGVWLVKSSGVNDAVHHIVCAFQQTAALSGTTLALYFQLSDAATNQVCIVFRSDGAILLTSATPAGTVLATYTGAVTLINQWFAFEFEVVIHPTAGRFRVRKNGNTSDDFDSGATLNTRPGANSYANKLTLQVSANVASQQLDDLLWRSDASSVPFIGDVRCYTRMPASDASVQFSRSPATATQTPFTSGASNGITTGVAKYTPFTAANDGPLGAATVTLSTGFTGNLKCSIFAASGGVPTTPLGSTTIIANPITGSNAITFTSPATVVKGTQYFIGFDTDVSSGSFSVTSGSTTGFSSTTAYAAFPTASPATTVGFAAICSLTISISANSNVVSEAQQDGATSYVYSSNVGDTDLYNIASIGVTPASTVAVTTRAFVQKSDAGSRSGKVLLKSGGTTVDTGSATLQTTWAQMWRTDTVDPATGTAWTAVGVNAAQIGVTVAS